MTRRRQSAIHDADDERQARDIQHALEEHVERPLQGEVAEPAQDVLVDADDGRADEEQHHAVEERQMQRRRQAALPHLGLRYDVGTARQRRGPQGSAPPLTPSHRLPPAPR